MTTPDPFATSVAVLLAAVLLWVRRPAPRPLVEKVGDLAGRTWDADIDSALAWLPPEADWAERRRSARRRGPPTPIQLTRKPATDDSPEEAEEGLVLDRSTGGVCFAAHGAFAVGDEICVRPTTAMPGTPWVRVAVRYCRRRDDYCLVGCQFLDALTWDILLLFG
jgi:hypothetical protein